MQWTVGYFDDRKEQIERHKLNPGIGINILFCRANISSLHRWALSSMPSTRCWLAKQISLSLYLLYCLFASAFSWCTFNILIRGKNCNGYVDAPAFTNDKLMIFRIDDKFTRICNLVFFFGGFTSVVCLFVPMHSISYRSISILHRTEKYSKWINIYIVFLFLLFFVCR